MVLPLLLVLSLGTEGKYRFFDIPVDFVDAGIPKAAKLATGLLGGVYFNFFLHEVGHCFAHRYVYGDFGKIRLHSDGTSSASHRYVRNVPAPLQVLIAVGGPLADVIFGNLRALLIHKSIYWIRMKREGAPLNKVETLIFKILKFQTYLSLGGLIVEPSRLLYYRNAPTEEFCTGKDLMEIYYWGGAPTLIGSMLVLGTLGACAVKILRNDPVIKLPARTRIQLRAKALIKQLHKTVGELNVLGTRSWKPVRSHPSWFA